MPDPSARELSVSYAGVTVGGNSHIALHGDPRLRHARELDKATVEFHALVVEESEAAFAQTCRSLEAAFRKPFQSLAIAQGAQILASYGKPPGTEVFPSIEKAGSEADSGRSRLYRISCEVRLPADWSSTAQLHTLDVDLSYSPSRRRTVRISGTFTGKGSTTARSSYDSAISALASSITSGFGGTYELAEEPRTVHDLNNHRLEFEQIWEEVIFSQGGASTNDPAIVRQSLTLSRSDLGPGDSGSVSTFVGSAPSGTSPPGSLTPVRRLAEITAEYDASIDKSQSTDLKGKWDSIRSWVFQQMENTFGVSGMAIVEETVVPIPDSNRLRATVRALAKVGSETYERRVTLAIDSDEDEVLVKVWDDNPYSRLAFKGPRTYTRSVTVTEKVVGSKDAKDAADIARGLVRTLPPPSGKTGKFTTGKFSGRATPITLGIDGHSFAATELEGSGVQEFYNPVSSGSGGGGGGGGGGTGTGKKVTTQSGGNQGRVHAESGGQ